MLKLDKNVKMLMLYRDNDISQVIDFLKYLLDENAKALETNAPLVVPQILKYSDIEIEDIPSCMVVFYFVDTNASDYEAFINALKRERPELYIAEIKDTGIKVITPSNEEFIRFEENSDKQNVFGMVLEMAANETEPTKNALDFSKILWLDPQPNRHYKEREELEERNLDLYIGITDVEAEKYLAAVERYPYIIICSAKKKDDSCDFSFFEKIKPDSVMQAVFYDSAIKNNKDQVILSNGLIVEVYDRMDNLLACVDMCRNLTEGNLKRRDLRGKDFIGANLNGVNLEGVDLRGAFLNNAHLSEAILSGADLRGADLRGADLSRASLSGASLSGANLRGADLSRAELRSADLSRANLIEAHLKGADLSSADLSSADLSRADLIETNLKRANLSRANLIDAHLEDADLSRADLIEANLKRADLSRADLREADLWETNTKGANFEGADLSGVRLNIAFSGSADLVDNIKYQGSKNINESEGINNVSDGMTIAVIMQIQSVLENMARQYTYFQNKDEAELTADLLKSLAPIMYSKYGIQIDHEYTLGREKKNLGKTELYFFTDKGGIKQEQYILENKKLDNFTDQYLQLMGYLNPNFSAGITVSINTEKGWTEAYDYIEERLRLMIETKKRFAPVLIKKVLGDISTRYIQTVHIVPETGLTMPVYHLVLQLSNDERLSVARKARK